MRLASVDDLRTVYRSPGKGGERKVIHQLDEHCAELPSAACIFKDHAHIDADAALIEADLEHKATHTLWRLGGDEVEA